MFRKSSSAADKLFSIEYNQIAMEGMIPSMEDAFQNIEGYFQNVDRKVQNMEEMHSFHVYTFTFSCFMQITHYVFTECLLTGKNNAL